MSTTHDALEEARGYLIAMHDTIHVEAKIDICIFCDPSVNTGQRVRAHMGIDDWTPATTEPRRGQTISVDMKSWEEEVGRLPQEGGDFRSALIAAFEFPFKADNVTMMHACVPGAAEDLHWYWVVRVGTYDAARWWLVDGWCDYTGWDCQAGADADGPHLSALAAANKAPILDSSNRGVLVSLMRQISGDQPYGVYYEEEKAG